MKREENVGGQAVYEGVMMRKGINLAVAVRNPMGEIVVDKYKLQPVFKKWAKIPFLRGLLILMDSLVWGIKALTYSTNVAFPEEEKIDSGWGIFFALVLSFALFVALFIVLPLIIVKPIESYVSSQIILRLIEGLIRIIIFIAYLVLVTNIKEIKRVFQYHGAEHKTVFCYEAGEELTVENCRKYSRFHPRCGTSFLLVVMIISVVIYAFLGKQGFIERIFSRVLLIPLIFSLSYEIIRLGSKHYHSKFWRAVILPGLWMQYLTTKEPDDSQLEVAIRALKEVLEEDAE
ncbi:MAG: hypothetical protein CBR30_04125 [Dictyoglomus sp. NZ13-RE01]|nr:MAG: hypothetical protein CBR30_04125 [Dictyoglomus sp. NZ13-RE01]